MNDFYRQLGLSNPSLVKKHAKLIAFFSGCDPVLELGPAQGYFLDLMRRHAIRARGVDGNPQSVRLCRTNGLDVVRGEAVRYLSRQKPSSLGGLFTSNLVEHLEPHELTRLLDLCCSRLRVGGRLALITSNPRSLGIHADSFYTSLDHRRLYPLGLLTALLEERGMDILAAREDEDSRGGGTLRRLVRKLRSLIVGPYFGPPEIFVAAVKTNRKPTPASNHLTFRR